MTDNFIGLLDFKFYIREEEYKNAERHIMYLIEKSFKDLGFSPVFEKDTVKKDSPTPQVHADPPQPTR